ncbi:MAG: sulfotransferase [Planctomycetes bacterium]|nr:sulfotransferase [Planctomycetota bacterium]
MTIPWHEISERMLRERPVFVVGVPRSGTTVLRNTLENHPSFQAKSPVSVETKVFQKPHLLPRILETEGAHLRRFLLDDDAAAREFLETLRRIEQDGGGETDLIRAYFHFAMLARGVKRLIEKTPRHLAYQEEILAAFPLARIIITFRHPIDVYSSCRKKLQKARKRGKPLAEQRWLEWTPGQFAKRFRQWAREIDESFARRPDRVYRVAYERLTADSRRVLAEICAFLDEPFDEQAMFAPRDVVIDRSGSPRPRSRIVENRKRWQKFLGEEEARDVEDQLEDSLPRLRYERYTQA